MTTSICVLRPQEVPPTAPESIYFLRFSLRVVRTAGVGEEFSDDEIASALEVLRLEANKHDGIDYLAVFDVGSRVLWATDNGEHVTLMLPSEY